MARQQRPVRTSIADRPERFTVAQFRASYRARGAGAARGVDGCTTHAESVAGRSGPIALRRFVPDARGAAALQPAILFLHGGGWVAGGLDSHDRLCHRIVRLTGAQVIAVAYRLAPEHPFPGAVEDAIDAYAMLLPRAAGWGVDAARVAVMGDGAGGTLAAVVALHARDMCLPVPCAQALLWPLTDMAGDAPAAGPMIEWLRAQYVPSRVDPADWRLSPLRATSLRGLPASFVAVAGGDPLHDEGLAFGRRLHDAGVPVTVHASPAQAHELVSPRRDLGEAERTLAAAAAFLRARLDVDAAITV